ncbi:autoinducer synthase [Rhodosalinus halophilus]|uniref:Acyl-homoserine-lactone synthase n=1 Tax=Rhodosalinus halophilus TaxID=2259333 RepID=A0A365U6N9_9RHOB|nr:acyl-homoserine-lactone synthase [Rhodosalinus halophilus]RBI84079.1 autoinducer synthase [Rhodosalinus halophilus]
MLRLLSAERLARHPRLADEMFRHRAAQFRDRLGWEVQVDADGRERDAYDALDPLYLIWQRAEGGHGGSFRLMPTAGRCMVNEHFADVAGVTSSPFIWEVTRFCLAPRAEGQVAAALMLGGGAVMRAAGLEHLLGVFDARMERIYVRIGAAPEVLGRRGKGRDRIGVGLWRLTPEAEARVAARAGLSPDLVARWVARDFDAASVPAPARSA